MLALNVPVPGFRRHFLLTKTLEWNLYWWERLGWDGLGAACCVMLALVTC